MTKKHATFKKQGILIVKHKKQIGFNIPSVLSIKLNKQSLSIPKMGQTWGKGQLYPKRSILREEERKQEGERENILWYSRKSKRFLEFRQKDMNSDLCNLFFDKNLSITRSVQSQARYLFKLFETQLPFGYTMGITLL